MRKPSVHYFGASPLTLEPGATLRFDEDDNSQGGLDPNRNELILQSPLWASGSNAAPITLSSSEASPSAGAWYGIVLEPAASLVTLEHVNILDAAYGIQGETDTPGTDLILNNVTIGNVQSAGVYLYPLHQHQDVDRSLSMTHCTVNMQGAPYGIYIKDSQSTYEAYDISMNGVAINGDNSGTYGLYLDMQGYDGTPGWYGKDADIDTLTVSGLSGGAGVYVADYAPLIHGLLSISGCKWGVQLFGNGEDFQNVGPSLSGEHGSLISDCTTGIYAASLGGSIVNLTIDNCITGLYTSGYFGTDDAEIDYVAITGGSTGIRGLSMEPHRFRSGSVTGFSGFGVDVGPATGLDMGTEADAGNNSIYADDPVKYMRVKPLVVGMPDAKAELNWWGTYPPPAGMFSAQVDYTPALSDPPSGNGPLSRASGVAVVTPRVLTVTPNPFRETTALTVKLSEGALAQVEIFDLQGRRVRGWENLRADTRIEWDGRDDGGRPVGFGVYFVRVRTESGGHREVTTRKLVRLH